MDESRNCVFCASSILYAGVKMKLKLDWQEPIALTTKEENRIYTCDHSKLPEAGGIYIFGRIYGKAFEALYVGQAINLQARVKGQLKNLPLMLHVRDAASGRRVVCVAKFVSKRGQVQKKCLKILEEAFIRYFLSEAHDLVNVKGTKLRKHEIVSEGTKRFFPSKMFCDL